MLSRGAVPLLLGLVVIVLGSAMSLASWRAASDAVEAGAQARFETASRALLARMDSDVVSALVLARALAAASQVGVNEPGWQALLTRIDADAFGLPIRAVARLAPDGNGPLLWADLARPAPPGAPSAPALDTQAPAIQEALLQLARDRTAQAARDGLAVLGARGEDGARVLLLIEARRWLDLRAAVVADMAACACSPPARSGKRRRLPRRPCFPPPRSAWRSASSARARPAGYWSWPSCRAAMRAAAAACWPA
ncbi:hypothetical protein [Niveibacterium sp. SC-1]|uniref:hypothetical protein n=1 Tax=Niveibacterium sp. SC-1 TaxID=3135646 RepID=UPI00311F2FC7